MANGEPNPSSSDNGVLIKAADVVRQAPPPMILQLGNAADEGGGAFSFSIMWQALLQRLKLAAPLGVVLAAVACAALYYFTEPKFRSQSTLRIEDKQPALVFNMNDQSQTFAQTQIELIRGSYIISRAVEEKGLNQLPELRAIAGKEDAVAWIAQRLKAVRIGQSQVYEVSFTTCIQESARQVVAAIVDTYMSFQTDLTDTQRQTMLEVLKEEVQRLDGDIDRKRKSLRELAQSVAGDDAVVMPAEGAGGAPSSVTRFALMNSLQQKLVSAEVDLEMAKARVHSLTAKPGLKEVPTDGKEPVVEADDEIEVPEGYIASVLAKDPGIVALEKELQNKLGTLQKLQETHPKRKRAEAEIEKIEADIKAKKAELQPKIEEEVRERFAGQRRDSLNLAQADMKSKLQTIHLLRERIETERQEQSQHGDKSLELRFASDELKNVESVRKQISDRIIHLRTEGRAPAQVTNIQKAKTPEFQEGPSLGKKLAMVGFGGFFAPFLLLIGWDLMHRRVLEREQLEREFDLKFVSEVATLPVRPVLPRLGAERAYQLQTHLFEESVNSLRTSLAVDENLKDSHVFVVASAVSGEGKTNLSAQLAMSWSHAIQGKVLIIDCDLRAPNIHDLFEIKADKGVAEVLRGECPVEDAIVMDWGDRLFVLPAGDAGATSPSHLFSGPRFRNLLTQLRAQFDKIIIDVPPVLCASETLLIAKEADGVLMCARHDYSRSSEVKQAYTRMLASGIKVAGAVLNGSPVRKYSYSYRGYAPV